jgi:broad specificity phosphatase PhoE
MTGFLFVRHTSHDLITSKIAGRMPGVHLNARGLAAAERLAEDLSCLPIRQIYCGPLERARQTAEPLSRKLNLPLHVAAAFDEIETGEWTGKTFEELKSDPEWQKWNAFRSSSRAPGGEVMLDVQSRVLNKLSQLSAGADQGLTAIFSHGDVIRATVAYFLAVPLDLFLRIAIDPGSLTWIELYQDSALIKLVNGTGADAIQRAF